MYGSDSRICSSNIQTLSEEVCQRGARCDAGSGGRTVARNEKLALRKDPMNVTEAVGEKDERSNNNNNNDTIEFACAGRSVVNHD